MSSHVEIAASPRHDASVHAMGGDKARGKLSVFLGYAPRVGKTYAMLDAAQARRAAGVDVVVACIETHGQPETQALLEGMEIIPCRGGKTGVPGNGDLAVDAVLQRRPGLALVDELAHTNTATARHPKRYQDVQELLAAGIDVYATLNIQNLESLKDVVAQITGVVISETVPDRVLDEANESNLVDLSPDELLLRLNKNPGEFAAITPAEEGVFRHGILTALREIALRRAAARVDSQMRAYMQAQAIPGPWPAAERLLVCVSPGT